MFRTTDSARSLTFISRVRLWLHLFRPVVFLRVKGFFTVRSIERQMPRSLSILPPEKVVGSAGVPVAVNTNNNENGINCVRCCIDRVRASTSYRILQLDIDNYEA